MFGDQLWLESAVAIARRVEGEFTEFTVDRLGGMPIAPVFGGGRTEGLGGILRQGRDDFTSEVDIHFGIEHAFESGLHQRAEEPVEVVEGLGLGGDFAGELLGLELKGRVHSGISIRKVG